MMLRKFEADDGKTILGWIKSEREFRLWSADRFSSYPITAVELAAHYDDCTKTGAFFPFTAVDEQGNIIGHLILRYTNSEKDEVRVGFVIVDSSIRGQGIGRSILELAKKYAFETLGVNRLSLGVFENNSAAVECYKAAGFKQRDGTEEDFCILGEQWKCIEMINVRI